MKVELEKLIEIARKIDLKFRDIHHFPLLDIVNKPYTVTVVKIVKNMKFQIDFSSYLAQFFELNLHIWYLGSYLNMFLEKINVFVKKYFFVSWGRFWVKNSVICCSPDPVARFPFSPKM